jgi:prepilin-type N-terminal cleavage/methylation domain-containing protein
MYQLGRKQAGFTLIELLAALFVSSIILGALMLIFHSGAKTTFRELDGHKERMKQQEILIFLTKEIKRAKQVQYQTFPDRIEVTLIDPLGKQTVYEYRDQKAFYVNGTYWFDALPLRTPAITWDEDQHLLSFYLQIPRQWGTPIPLIFECSPLSQ